MNAWRVQWLRQPLVGLLLVVLVMTLLGPLLSGCASKPARPQVLQLTAIVVDGARLARPGETGLVAVWRDGQQLDTRAGMPLRPGDRIETGFSATAVLRWPNGSMLYVRPNSSGVVGSFTRLVGEVFAKIRGAFAVETQYVRAGALGTEYLVRSGPGGATTVVVLEGRVQVASLLNAWPAVVVGAGASVLAHPQPPQPVSTAPAEVQRIRDWVAQVDRLLPAATSGGLSTGEKVAVGAAVLGAAILIAGSRDKKPDTPAGAGDRAPAQPQAQPQPQPPVLVAPANPRPGSADERSAPSLVCRDPLVLDWDAVNGARDYLAVLERRAASGAWSAVSQMAAISTDARTPAGLDGLYRWRVQARAAGVAGPFSAWLHMRCSPFRLG